MAVVKRTNDPEYGIRTEYVDPCDFVHSYTEDPNFDDLAYAGHVRYVTIHELRRMVGDQLNEEDFKKIASQAQKRYGYDRSKLTQTSYDQSSNSTVVGFDEYRVGVLDFEFLSVDCEFFESKESRHGNIGVLL